MSQTLSRQTKKTVSLLPEPSRKRPFYVYEVKRLISGSKNSNPLFDLGFNFYRNLEEIPRGKSLQDLEGVVRWDLTQKKWERDVSTHDRYHYHGRVSEVIDGDTFRVVIDLGFKCFTRQYLRLSAVNAPELKTSAGKKVKVELMKLLAEGAAIEFISLGYDRYRRYISDVWFRDEYLSNFLLKNHLAKKA